MFKIFISILLVCILLALLGAGDLAIAIIAIVTGLLGLCVVGAFAFWIWLHDSQEARRATLAIVVAGALLFGMIYMDQAQKNANRSAKTEQAR